MAELYKILKHGRSFHGGSMKWSLPRDDGTPGDWHEVPGDLVQCRNGLHLTPNPSGFIPKKLAARKSVECFLAETEGDRLDRESEVVCRRVRLIRRVPWADFAAEANDPSPAILLLQHVWDCQGDDQNSRSWRRLNGAMQAATTLAIESGMEFGDDDFKYVGAKFNPSYWLNIEGCYSRAIEGPHGPNSSAIQAIEKHLGRKPFIVAETTASDSRIRLHEGSWFDWHVDFRDRVPLVKVTSFRKADDGTQYVVACTYKKKEKDPVRGYEIGPDKIDRTFKITHADITAYHKAIRAARAKAGVGSEIAPDEHLPSAWGVNGGDE